MQFSTKAFFTAALLVTGAVALPNESAPGARKAYYKDVRRFGKWKRPCTTTSTTPTSTPTPSPPAPPPPPAPEPTPEPTPTPRRCRAAASRHSTGGQRGDQGENLYWQSHDKTPCANAAASWASEISLYNGQPIGQGDFSAYGHYTQMIWKSSTKVGLGIANDGKGGVYVVARYNPAGNYIGQTPTR
ncbi:hypothetical protein MAPG_08752 [Magnaporthiopsis poae ATCC 64411]|uniref:SCP domain-containing protein n=1 Tax=Magnaporthiopsis poae (strain ATCC 64411 / 73-15) TaxID=644358 RepID=A0A0C4E862_MAGP6|nr:hypothetical protein MAPG_08752 [Magnaporthiopsis poae ATCC 64411]